MLAGFTPTLTKFHVDFVWDIAGNHLSHYLRPLLGLFRRLIRTVYLIVDLKLNIATSLVKSDDRLLGLVT